MQSDEQYFPGKAVPPIGYQVGGGYLNYGHITPDLAPFIALSPEQSSPLHGVELQPSDVCPRNFIIFDQTGNNSRIMYHPALKQKFPYPCPSIDMRAAFLQGEDARKDLYTDMYATKNIIYSENTESSSSLKEDTKDIDALMSLEEEELEEDDEVISTARTRGNYDYGSPDSCSNSVSGCCSSNRNNERQRKKMKKMVKALRGIVPGADKMPTAALIDEAVTYLKSLKVEVKKLGLGNFKN